MFNPWAAGPRVCPGKKFSQVEFVAVVARLFQKGRVTLKVEAGEKQEEAFKRINDVVADSTLDVTLRMKYPEKVRLVWQDER
jgi:cytochrome P450